MTKERRSYSANFKRDTVAEGWRGEKMISEICREREIGEAMYYQWKERFQERATDIFAGGRRSKKADDSSEAQIAELERMVEHRLIYLAVILGAYTRAVRGWALGRSLEQSLTIRAFKDALACHPAPDYHHFDQGRLYAAADYLALFGKAGAHISMSAVGQPTQNDLVELFMRTLKEKYVDFSDYYHYEDRLSKLEVEYMTQRTHSALDYLTPAESDTQLLTA